MKNIMYLNLHHKKVFYVGTLVDTGEIFDNSSYTRNSPQKFTVGRGEVVAGLDHAILNMKQGEIAYIWTSWGISYGKLGCMPRIPPKADLLYHVELVEVLPPGKEPKVANDEDTVHHRIFTAGNEKLVGNDLFGKKKWKLAKDKYKQVFMSFFF